MPTSFHSVYAKENTSETLGSKIKTCFEHATSMNREERSEFMDRSFLV